MITYRNDLSITPGGRQTEIHLSQNDDDFKLIFDLYTSIGDFVVQSNSSVTLQGRFFNGQTFEINGSISGKQVTFNGNKQLTKTAGTAIAEITIKRGGKQLSTANFKMVIEPKA